MAGSKSRVRRTMSTNKQQEIQSHSALTYAGTLDNLFLVIEERNLSVSSTTATHQIHW